MRKPFIAGNWKMNKTMKATKDFFTAFVPNVTDATCDIVLCMPFTDIATAKKCVKGTNVKIGAENIHWAESGAFTGEVSGEMLRELRCDYVIIGHSERRQYFNETDETVNKRTAAALASKVRPIVCVGETLVEREEGRTEEVLYTQIVDGLKGFKTREFDKMVIAYEPVWAIGTGKTATPEDANKTIGFIRDVLAKKFSKIVADNIRILYGGSMNVGNVKALMAQPEIDGGLIGGASLKPDDFAKIVNYDK